MKEKLIQIINLILIQVTLLRKKLIIKLSNDFLGTDFTPTDKTPDMLACAEAVTTILVKAGALPMVITGTWTLEQYLMRSKNWVPVATPEEGDVLVSATGTSSKGSKAPFVGHTAIVGKNGLLYSNDSYTGKWKAHYDMNSWRKRYVEQGGYQMAFYRYVSVL